jgi:two-component system cell cycle sensor histidine kinase/response regulator CckA
MKEKLEEARQTDQAETPGAETQQAYEELQRKTEDLTLVNLLNDAINQGGSFQEAIKLLSQETRRLFSSYGATVYLLSEDKEYLVAQNLGLPPRLINTIEKLIGIKIPPLRVRLQGASLYSEKLKARESLLINDPETIQRYIYELTDDRRIQKLIPAVHKILGIHSMMGIPLISDGQVFGLIEISSHKTFTESDLQRLATIAGEITNIIKRKQAEEALKKSEEKFAKAFHSSPNAISISTLREGLCLDMNESFTAFTGYERDEVIGSRVTDKDFWVEPADRTRLVRMLQEQGRVRDLEVKLRIKSGEIKVVLSSAEPIDIGGEPCILVTGQDITERKRTQEKLVESEEKYRELAESITDVFFAMDKQLRYTYWNRASEELTGISAENALGKHLRDVFSDSEQTRKVEEIYLNVLRTKKPESFVQEYQIGDKKFSFEINAYPTRNGLSVFVKDVTERKQAEGKHQAIIKTALDGFCLGNLEGRFFEVNDSYCKMTGYSREELLKMTIADIETSETPEEMAQRLQSVKQRGYDLFESKLRCKDGKIIDVEISMNYLEMDNGQVCVFIRDITERKQAEALFRTLANSSPIGIYIVQDGKFQFTNPQFQRLVGKSEEELVGSDSLSFVASEDREKVRENAVRMLKGELSQPYEYRSFNGHGEIRWVLETIAPIEYRGRRAVVGTHMDITESKMLQQEQQRLGKLESIGTLAGGIAHDFNNILTGIMGNISLALRNVESDSKVAERLLEAEKASLRAKDLTHRLLTFARGGAPIKKTVSIANLIKESAEFALRGSNTMCEYSLPDELWSLEADEGQLTQVFTNLVINASEAMPEGGTLHIRARNTVNKRKGPLPRGNYVEITVKDHGTGIASGHLERIFEPYFTTKQRGSGLGLATAHSIIKNHDGHIDVRSELGKGTTFTIYLPASSKPVPAKKKVVAEAPTPGKGRVLVMDDEPAIRALLNRILTGIGYKVELTTEGKEAIEKYAGAREEGQQPFDAVIMDLTIPGGMGGKETISHLLKIDPGVKAIVSSGYSTDPIMADYQKYGFRGVVAKPYVAADLEKALHNAILGLNE